MKKASLLVALCLLLLPAAALANSFSFTINGGTLNEVGSGINGCGAPISACNTSINSNASPGAPVSGYANSNSQALAGTPGHPLAGVAFSTPLVYSTAGTPFVSSTWGVTWVSGGAVQVDAEGALATAIGVSPGTEIFSGWMTNGTMISNHYGAGLNLYSLSAGVTGTFSNAFLAYAGDSAWDGKLAYGTLSLGNTNLSYVNGVAIATGSLVVNTPEPATLSLLGMGLLGLLGLRRRSS